MEIVLKNNVISRNFPQTSLHLSTNYQIRIFLKMRTQMLSSFSLLFLPFLLFHFAQSSPADIVPSNPNQGAFILPSSSGNNPLPTDDGTVVISEDGGKNMIMVKDNNEQGNLPMTSGNSMGIGNEGGTFSRAKRGKILKGMALGAVAGGVGGAIAG